MPWVLGAPLHDEYALEYAKHYNIPRHRPNPSNFARHLAAAEDIARRAGLFPAIQVPICWVGSRTQNVFAFYIDHTAPTVDIARARFDPDKLPSEKKMLALLAGLEPDAVPLWYREEDGFGPKPGQPGYVSGLVPFEDEDDDEGEGREGGDGSPAEWQSDGEDGRELGDLAGERDELLSDSGDSSTALRDHAHENATPEQLALLVDDLHIGNNVRIDPVVHYHSPPD